MTAEAHKNMEQSTEHPVAAATQNTAWARGLAPRPRNHARTAASRASEVAGRCALTRPRADLPGAAAPQAAGQVARASVTAAPATFAPEASISETTVLAACAAPAGTASAAALARIDARAARGAQAGHASRESAAAPAPVKPARPADPSPPWPRLHWPRIVIRPYAPADLDALILQPGQAHVQAQLAGRGYAQALAQTEAYTALLQEEDGGARVIACLGAHALHPGRALAWGLLSRDCGPHLLALTRAVRRWLASCPYARIEAHAEQGFAAGARWLRLLGFACETPQGMRRFTPEGRDSRLYAWLREEAPAAPPCPASTSTSTSTSTSEPFPDTARPA
jgi:hypothetical protein